MHEAEHAHMHHDLAPFTFEIGFLASALSEAADWAASWLGSLRPTDIARVSAPLSDGLRRLAPLTRGSYDRVLFVAADGPWVGVFGNGVEGSDLFSLVSLGASALHCDGVIAAWRPHLSDPRRAGSPIMQGAVSFSLYGAGRTDWLNRVRTVSVTENDGRWEFDADGTMLAFEDSQRYEARRRAERLTPQMVAEYCRALGIRPYAREFYRPTATVVARADQPKDSDTYSIEQARARLGLDPRGFG